MKTRLHHLLAALAVCGALLGGGAAYAATNDGGATAANTPAATSTADTAAVDTTPAAAPAATLDDCPDGAAARAAAPRRARAATAARRRPPEATAAGLRARREACRRLGRTRSADRGAPAAACTLRLTAARHRRAPARRAPGRSDVSRRGRPAPAGLPRPGGDGAAGGGADRRGGRHGARLVAFPESYVPGYPAWIFGAAGWDDPVAKRLHARLATNSLELGETRSRRCRPPRARTSVHVVMGATERDTGFSRGSLYNSLFFIDGQGELLGVHRKLMPTHAERLVWTPGRRRIHARLVPDRARPAGRPDLLGALDAADALRAARHGRAGARGGVAGGARDAPDRRAPLRVRGSLLRALRRQLLRAGDLPDDEELRAAMVGLGDLGGADDVLLPGGSAIIGPDGAWIAGPAGDEPEIVYGTSIWAASSRSSSRSTRPGTTTAPTSSRSRSRPSGATRSCGPASAVDRERGDDLAGSPETRQPLS